LFSLTSIDGLLVGGLLAALGITGAISGWLARRALKHDASRQPTEAQLLRAVDDAHQQADDDRRAAEDTPSGQKGRGRAEEAGGRDSGHARRRRPEHD
jgi:hypothetical protein